MGSITSREKWPPEPPNKPPKQWAHATTLAHDGQTVAPAHPANPVIPAIAPLSRRPGRRPLAPQPAPATRAVQA